MDGWMDTASYRDATVGPIKDASKNAKYAPFYKSVRDGGTNGRMRGWMDGWMDRHSLL